MYKINWDKYLSSNRDRESVFAKNSHTTDLRTAFDSDFGRVIFSSASRRMHDKTQVFPLTSGDKVHTRLTHSIEVMNIAESLGISLCRDTDFQNTYGKNSILYERAIPTILKTAAFVHDIGNPPFGHHGEDVIKDYFKDNTQYLEGLEDLQKYDFLQFDGNAAGFRILTKGQYLGDLSGLNLTLATLATYLKYPNYDTKQKNSYIGLKKHGVFYTEKDILDKIACACNLQTADGHKKRHPLSFLVEAADSICYLTMDIDDGLALSLYTYEQLIQELDLLIDASGNKHIKDILELKDKSYEPKNSANFRVALIGYFVRLALSNFKAHLEEIDCGTYNKELIFDDPLHIADALGIFAQRHYYTASAIMQAELTGANVLKGLLNNLLPLVLNDDKHLLSVMSPDTPKLVLQECGLYDPIIANNGNDTTGQRNPVFATDFTTLLKQVPQYYKLHLVVDWISGMTDKYAVQTYQKLCGMKL